MNKIIDENIESEIKEFLEKSGTQDVINKIEDDSEYQFKVVVTTEGVDRDGEVLEAGWIDFDAYLKNPVVLVNHEYKVESIVAKTTRIYQEGWKTIAEGTFAKGVEKAELVRSLYNQGMIKTVSIGFIASQRSVQNRDVIEKSEMLEFSFVAVPANPEALSLDGKVYKKCLEAGLVTEEKAVASVKVSVGDNIAFRNRRVWVDDDNQEVERIYPNENELPMMGKVIAKYDSGSLLNWDELITPTAENPFLMVQAYVKSKNGPILLRTYADGMEFDKIVVESVITEKSIEEEEVKFTSEAQIDNSSVVNNMKGIQDDIESIKESLKTFSEDNEKKKNREKAQEIVKAVSGYLRDTK